MSKFINGMDLCEGFFFDVAKKILDEQFPALQYTAGLLGYGSDVIQFDDEVSTDHMWGPRFYLFLDEGDICLKDNIMGAFSKRFPYEYKGYSVNFSVPDPNDGGVRHAQFIDNGDVSPLIFIYTIKEFLTSYLGVYPLNDIAPLDWLAFSEHRLLALSSGRIYVDMLGLAEELKQIKYYPDDVRDYLILSQWAVISQEQAFVKRTSSCGDEIGSCIITARITERLMRLCFLYLGVYAPYSKWFGSGFSRLCERNTDVAIIKQELSKAITSTDMLDRENHIVTAQYLVGELHNKSGITDVVENKIQTYFGRDIKVISICNFVDAMARKLAGGAFYKIPPIGTLCQVGNFVEVSDDPRYAKEIAQMYGRLKK